MSESTAINKKIAEKAMKRLLFPHIAIMLVLIPVSAVFLVYSMVFIGTESAVAIVSYVLAAYTLTVWCFKIPYLVRFFRRIKSENRYVRVWLDNTHLRVNVFLYGALIWNSAYAVFQLGLGFYHSSFWYYSMAGYYISLAVMRFFLVRHTCRYKPGEEMEKELIKCRTCGIILLVMNLALSVIILFMFCDYRVFRHHEITVLTQATYTFAAFAAAIVNAVKYRKYNSPVYSASKAVSLANACVSMLTLESVMLTTFSEGSGNPAARRILLGITGAVVSVFILTMAVYMITRSNKRLTNILKPSL